MLPREKTTIEQAAIACELAAAEHLTAIEHKKYHLKHPDDKSASLDYENHQNVAFLRSSEAFAACMRIPTSADVERELIVRLNQADQFSEIDEHHGAWFHFDYVAKGLRQILKDEGEGDA